MPDGSCRVLVPEEVRKDENANAGHRLYAQKVIELFTKIGGIFPGTGITVIDYAPSSPPRPPLPPGERKKSF